MTTPNEANEKLAVILIARLNQLLEDTPSLSETFGLLVRTRVACDFEIAKQHPTIQAAVEEGCAYVGFLGMLNGIVGAIPDGKKARWGYITAIVEDDKRVSGFQLTR